MLDRAGVVVPLVGTFRRSWPTCPLEKVSGRRRATDGERKPRGKGRATPFPLSAEPEVGHNRITKAGDAFIKLTY